MPRGLSFPVQGLSSFLGRESRKSCNVLSHSVPPLI